MPSPDLNPEESVRVQLAALQANDDPCIRAEHASAALERVGAGSGFYFMPNHGIQTAYEFADDTGSMERSRYFGYSKDLYHFDHFLGAFQTTFPEMIGSSDFKISASVALEGGQRLVDVSISKGMATK